MEINQIRIDYINMINSFSAYKKKAIYLDWWINHMVYQHRFHNNFTIKEINTSFEEFCDKYLIDWYDKFIHCSNSDLNKVE